MKKFKTFCPKCQKVKLRIKLISKQIENSLVAVKVKKLLKFYEGKFQKPIFVQSRSIKKAENVLVKSQRIHVVSNKGKRQRESKFLL